MSDRTNARDHAAGFVYWQSEIRRAEEIPQRTARVRDLMLLRSAVTELVCDELNYLFDGDESAGNAELAKSVWAEVRDDLEVTTGLMLRISTELGGDPVG